jgi:hypothetical protein
VNQVRVPIFTNHNQRLTMDLSWFIPFLALAAVSGWFSPELVAAGSESRERILAGLLIPLALSALLAVYEASRVIISQLVSTEIARQRRLYPTGSVQTGFSIPEDPGTELKREIIAPIAMLATAALCGLASLVSGQPEEVQVVLRTLAFLTGGIGAVNMLPALPFAGGSAFRAIFWFLYESHLSGTRAAFLYSQLFASIAFGFGGYLLVWRPEYIVPGLWCLLLGWYVVRSSRNELLRSMIITRASNVTAADAVSGLNPTVRAAAPLTEAIDILLEQKANGPGLVRNRNVYAGYLSLETVREIPRANWRNLNVQDALIPLTNLPESAPGADLLSVLRMHERSPEQPVLVLEEDGRISGLIDATMDARMLTRRGLARDVRGQAAVHPPDGRRNTS